MEIPLTLTEARDGRLAYGLPVWYRIMMGAIVAVIGAALFAAGQPPAVLGWIIFGLVLLAALYEERWTFDAAGSLITHRAGLVFLARKTEIALAAANALRLQPFVRGTIPGSADEAAENKAALEGLRSDDSGGKRAFYKKPYLCLVVETSDGARYLVDAVPARRSQDFKATASRIASYLGKPLLQGQSGA